MIEGTFATQLTLSMRYVEETGEKLAEGELWKVKKRYPKEWEFAEKFDREKKELWYRLPEDFRKFRGSNEYTMAELKEMVRGLP